MPNKNQSDGEDGDRFSNSINASDTVTDVVQSDHPASAGYGPEARHSMAAHCRRPESGSSSSFEDDETCRVPLLGCAEQGNSGRRRFCGILRHVTVEPWLFLLSVASMMQTTVTKGLVLQKLCVGTFHLNDSQCDAVNGTATVETLIQTEATSIELYLSLVETFPAIVFSLFLGAFSDRHGRKLPMLVSLSGYIVSSGLYAASAYWMNDVDAHLLPLASIPKAVCGGMLAVIISALSYVSDRSTPDTRTLRVAAVEGVVLLASPAGNLLGGYLYRISYVLVFVVAMGVEVVVLLYIGLFVQSGPGPAAGPRTKGEIGDTAGGLLKDFCSPVKGLKETFVTVFKKREANGRFQILLLMASFLAVLLPYFGQSTVFFLYTQLVYDWDVTTYSNFSALTLTCVSLGIAFSAVVFVRILKLPDMVLAITGILGGIGTSIVYIVSTSAKMMYLALIPLWFSGTILLAIRSQSSKIVPAEEQGKLFSVLGSCEAAIPLLSSVIYTQVYRATVATHPKAIFLLSSGLFVIPLILVIILFIDVQRTSSCRHRHSDALQPTC